ncbi:MAG: hypothetical protein GXO74_10440 [Calditrichaeota bacterium]|nr:hypothetical protein [Calditrichota bacterium]
MKLHKFYSFLIFLFIFFNISSVGFPQTRVKLPLDEEARKIVNIEQVTGMNSNLKLKVTLQNLTGQKVELLVPVGMVILSKSESAQNMLIVHDQIFEINALEKAKFELNTVCLEAWKNPPDSAAEEGMFFFKKTENQEISQLVHTVAKLENAISASVLFYQEGQIQFGDMDSYELLELAQHCNYSRLDSTHFRAKINEQIIQCALWQLTDKISFDDFEKILKPKPDEEKRELRDIAEMAQIVLAYGGLEPTIVLRRLLPLKIKE